MKRLLSMLVTGITFCGGAFGITPVTSIGSNPYFSTDLYPQDLLLREGNYFFYSPEYINGPFWGDIDEPTNKPRTTVDYTTTGMSVSRDGGTFSNTGTSHTINNNFGYALRLNENIMASLSVNSNVDVLWNHAQGDFTGNTYPEGETLPFDYKMGHTLANFSAHAMAGMRMNETALGVSVFASRRNTALLMKELTFSKYEKLTDSTYTDNLIDHKMKGENARAFWGWTEPGCNHVFGERGTQGDSWFQDQYAIGPVYNLNVLTGLTTKRMKSGASFNMLFGHQEQFSWVSKDTLVGNDELISERYYGSYQKNEMARINWYGEGRVFSNIAWLQGDHYSANTFFSLRYADSSVGTANADNLEAESSSKDRKMSVELECYPNMSAKLGTFLNYIDIAGILAYKYSRYNNTTESWVGGGTLKTYQSGSVREGWGDVWENFSYANENVIDLGADVSTMFPLFSEGMHHLSLNIRMLGDVRFTFQKKYFVSNVENGSSVNYSIDNIRDSYMREVMFNTALMLHYMNGPLQFRLHFTKPVLYSMLPRTEVTNGDGDREDGYPLEKMPQLISQRGLDIGFYASYDVVLPFMQR